MKRIPLLLAVVLVGSLLASCADNRWREFRFSEPSEYYFYYPEATQRRGPPPLLIALLGESRSALDCMELFHSYAVDRGISLLCPGVQGGDDLEDRLQAETNLAAILAQIYTTHLFQDRFFLAGFRDAGTFALEYGLKYPGAVGGVSAMSVETFPELPVPLGVPPVQLLVGESDQKGSERAEAQEQTWRSAGMLIRVASVDGDGRSPSIGFARLASELIDQIVR